MNLKPFWAYYGGKWRAAPRYPKPLHDTIIEPFAGAAGYSMRYADRNIILVEKYAVIAEMWRYLVAVTPEEIRRIPLVDSVHDLPAWVPEGGRALVGFRMNNASANPCVTMSSGLRKLRSDGVTIAGWSYAVRERCAIQVAHIKHWRVIEGDYTSAPRQRATWFIDPPYDNEAGSHYKHTGVDYAALAAWCRTRLGQVIVCENEGATWLPFQPFATLKAGVNGNGSKEVVWVNQ